MGTITLTLPVAGNQITAGLHAANYAAIQAAINGDIDSANIEDGSVGRTELATITRKGPINFNWLAPNATSSIHWPDASTTDIYFFIFVPDDYVSGDITVKIFRRRTAAGAGTVVMQRSTTRYRDATALSTIETNTAINMSTDETVSRIHSFTIAAAGFAAGDTIRVGIERVGGDAGDTYANVVACDGGWFEYSGKA